MQELAKTAEKSRVLQVLQENDRELLEFTLSYDEDSEHETAMLKLWKG